MTASRAKAETAAVAGPQRLEFTLVYRQHVGPLTAFFARRCREPQDVADLTSQTFVEAIRSAHTYVGRGPVRAWLIAIARRVYARHSADQAARAELIDQLGGQLELSQDEVDELAARIDARRDGQELFDRIACFSTVTREAIELVDLVGLTPKDAAQVLGVSPNTLRVRLFRAHNQLRKDPSNDVV